MFFQKFGISALVAASALIAASVEAQYPTVLVDTNGNAIATWEGSVFNGTAVYAAVMDTSGDWSTQVQLSANGINTATIPVPAIINNTLAGDSFYSVIWAQSDSQLTYLYGAMLTSTAGTWTTGNQISTNDETVTDQYGLEIVQGISEPIAYAVWSSYDQFGMEHIRLSSANVDASNSWATPVTISN